MEIILIIRMTRAVAAYLLGSPSTAETGGSYSACDLPRPGSVVGERSPGNREVGGSMGWCFSGLAL